jgi:hypothetical protein
MLADRSRRLNLNGNLDFRIGDRVRTPVGLQTWESFEMARIDLRGPFRVLQLFVTAVCVLIDRFL